MTPQQKIAEHIYELLPHKGDLPEIIRLADILLAIKKHITVTEDKDWLPFDVLCRKVIIQNHYNLEKDNILDQSDEFCKFLLELLK